MKINNHEVKIYDTDFGNTVEIDGKVKLFQTVATGIFGYTYGDEEHKIVEQTFPNLDVASDDGYRRHWTTDRNKITG